MSAASSVSWAFLLSAAVISVASSVGAVTNDMEDDAPRITHPPRDQKVLDNTIVSFQCLAAGNPIPEVYWKRAGRRIVAPSPPAASASASGITGGGTGTHTSGGSTGNRPRHFVIPVPHGSVLRIDPAKARRDDGMVECVAENGVGEPAVAQATLEVHADGVAPPGYPRIVEGPSLKAVEKDRSTVMICSAIGNPEPTVTWYKDYVPVDLMDPRLKILPTGSLQIRHSLESDEGKYECVAENHIGVAFSYGANLYVRVRRVPPHFSVPPESVEVMPGGSVNLTCVAIGSPMPEVRWRLGAVDLTPEQSAPVGKNVLMLNDVRDSATYTCVAASELGNIEYDAEVRVKALPRAPTSLVVTDVAADYVRLSWNSGNVETIPSYVVQFRPKYPTSSSSSSSGISNVAIDDVSLSESFREVTDVRQTEFQVRGLLPFTVYEMRVMAVNGVGRSLPSASVDVTTAELAPGSPPINVKARPVSSSATFVQWDEPQNPNGVIRGYKVYYTLSPDLPVNLWTVHPVDGVTELTTITNLLTNRSYTIRVLGYTNVGDGPLSESVQVKMLPGVLYQEGVFDIPEQPTNLQGEPTSPNTIQLTWDAPDMSPDDVIDSYELYYNDSHFRQNIRVTISPPRNTYLLEDLTPDTVYHVRVAARSARGEGASTPTVQVRTPEFVPGEPRRVKVEPYNSTAVTVQWRPPADAEQNGIIRGYRIHYVQLSGLEVDDNSETMVPVSPQHVAKTVDVSDTSRTELIVGGLQPDTAYQFQVAGFTRKGEGDRTKPRKVKTKGAVPSPPRGLQLSLTQEDPPVVTLTWSTPRHTHGNVEGYKLLYGVKGEYTVEERRFDGDKMRFTTGFLERGVEYEFRVAAKNGVDFGEAASETFRTPDGIPGAAPQNFTAIGLSSTSVKLQWDPPPKRLRNGEIIMYEVVYRRRGNELEDLAANSTEPWLLIEGLEVNSDYVFQLRAYTSRGCGPWSNRLPFRTFGNHILPAPTNVQLRRVSPTTIEISWDSPRYPGVSGYRVYYRPTSQYGVLPLPGAGAEGPVTEQGIEVTVDTALDGSWLNKEIGPYTSTELSGLEPGVIYAVKVRAKTADGRLGNLSEAVWTRRRDSDHPDVVQDFHVKSLDARSATFEWKPPRTVGVFRYKLEYEGIRQTRDPDTVIENTLIDPRKDQMVVKEQRSLYIDNLLPRTMYTFNISALFINGDWGPPVSLRVETSQEAPSAVEPPRLLPFHEDGTVTVKLSPSQNEALADVTHYLVIVVPEELARRKLPNDFRLEDLDTRPVDHFDGKMTSRGPTAWIAARYEVNSLPSEMILGDGTWPGSGHYFNRKLPFSGGRMNGFRVFVRAMTANNKPTSSAYSERLVLPPDGIPESQVVIESERGSSSFNLLAVVAPICATIVLALLLALVVIVARKRRTAWKSTPSLPQTTKITPRVNHCSEVVSFTVTAQPVDPVEMRRLQYPTQVLRNHPPIPIQEFVAHVIQCKMNEGARFSAEYESIDPGGCGGPAGSPTTINRRAPASFGTSSSSNNPPLTWEASSAEVNKSKNRYANVVAYDHSRVRLVTGSGSVTAESGDYINANFVDGYRRPGAYIATQGPLPDTFTDFWRMVWDHRCSGIVMMTKLEERSRIKCDQYWPSRAMETYGSVHVTPVDVLELASYTIRTFQLTRDGRDERREIRQFQFTAWPDHGVPVHPTPLLLFMRRVKFMTNQDSGPLVVHCSAGVGRTGVFIAIDSQLERIRHVPTIDIYGQVTLMRSQRNYMVQTEDQYVFAHDALVEAVQSGNTEVPTRSLLAHVHRLSERIPNCGGQVSSTTCGANSPAPAETGMALEFRRLTCLKTGANPELFVSANLPCNKSKNRLVNVLPLEATRVLLQPIRGVEGSDYINANYIDGYRSKRAYIATQGPLAETTEEFWRMLWENNCNIVVMLTKLCELGREKCYQYWPNDRSARYQYFVVDPLAEYNMPHYILREFKVTDARDGQSRTLRQFQFTDWPEQGVPPSGEGFIELIGQVHKTKEQFGQEGPITVHCSAGVGRTGVFITLSIVLERMKYEAVIDMFQTVNMLRTQRPLLVQSEDQYSFCYRAMLEYIGSYDQRYVS